MAQNLMVRAIADFSTISNQSQKAQKSVRTMANSSKHSISSMQNAFKGLKSVLGTLGIALSIGAIVSAAKSAKKAYDAQTEAETKLATVMRQRMSATNDEIKSVYELCSAQQELGVIGDEVQIAGAQQMSTFLSESKSVRTLIPAMNNLLAQQKGLNATQSDAVTIGNLIGKVMQGQTSALSRAGITFTAAQEAVLKYGNEADRAAMLAQVITDNVGEMNAALAATPAGRLKQVSNTLGDIKEQFGRAVSTVLTLFIPALQVLASLLSQVATLANRAAQAFANVFGRAATQAKAAAPATAAVAAGLNNVSKAAAKAGKEAQRSSFGFDTLVKLSGGSSSSGDAAQEDTGTDLGAVGGLPDMAETAVEGVGWLEKALENLKGWISEINFEPLTSSLQRLGAAAAFVGGKVWEGLSWAFENILKPIVAWFVESYLPEHIDILTEALKLAGAAFEAFLPYAQELWEYFLLPALDWTGDLVVAGLEMMAAILALLAGDWDAVRDHATQAWTLIQSAWAKASAWFKESVVAPIASFFGWMWNGIMTAGSLLATRIQENVINPIVEAFRQMYNSVVGIIEGVINGFVGIINGFIRGINGVIDTINKIPGVSLNHLSQLNTVTVPRLADGAVLDANKPFLAMVGDQRRGTNIEAPLDTIVEAVQRAMPEGGARTEVSINFEGRLAQLARVLAPYIKAETKRIGSLASES